MTSNDQYAIVAEGLSKKYGKNWALRDLSLAVSPATVYGLLGPNGAGKTTAVRILTTLLRPDGGRAFIAGHDVVRDAELVRYQIGLAGQYAAVDEMLTGRDNLRMFGQLYHLSNKQAKARADELLEHFGLTDAADRLSRTYSGGMRRRLDLAASMIIAPKVLFMDEPTTGLDPRSRNAVWSNIREMVAEGTTVLLTTQYLDEADQLASRIGVVNAGSMVSEGTPDELKANLGGAQVEVVVRDIARVADAATALRTATGGDPIVNEENRQITIAVTGNATAVLGRVVRELDLAGIEAEDLSMRRPTLDEVFLRITSDGTETPAPRTEQENDMVGADR